MVAFLSDTYTQPMYHPPALFLMQPKNVQLVKSIHQYFRIIVVNIASLEFYNFKKNHVVVSISQKIYPCYENYKIMVLIIKNKFSVKWKLQHKFFKNRSFFIIKGI